MIGRFYVISTFILIFVFVGCGSIGKSIVGKQEWSANYAREKGVEATSPDMIDGSLSSVGETQTPMNAGSRGVTEYTEAFVKFPEAKSIKKIVVYTPNAQMEYFTLYSVGKTEDSLKSIGEVKNNRENKVEFSVSTVTNQIMIKVRKTSDDEVYSTGRSRKQLRRAKGKIQEIEIYGMQEATEAPPATASGQAVTASAAGTVPGTSAEAVPPVEEKPKAPPMTVSLESAKNTYALTGPIPVKMNIKIGPDDLTVLADSVTEPMLRTKLTVKDASGAVIKCAKQPPRLSFPKPYRGTGKEVSVRNAAVLDANSVVTVNIPNLLEYYPMDKPGTYTVQIGEKLEVHEKYLGSAQTEREDMERTIRDINARSNYSAQEKATLIATLREEMASSEKVKSARYLEVGARGNPIDMASNVLELVIQ